MTALTGEQIIDHYLAAGWMPDEIVDELAGRPLLLESGDIIYGDPPGRRRLEALVAQRSGRPHAKDPEWTRLTAAYKREAKRSHQRPTEEAVAKAMGWSTAESLRTRLRRWGIDRWADVHAMMEPDAG